MAKKKRKRKDKRMQIRPLDRKTGYDENVPPVNVCGESQFKCPEKPLGIVRSINVKASNGQYFIRG